MSLQQTEFQERMARLNAQKQSHPKKAIKTNYIENFGYVFSFVLAFLSGILSVILVRLVSHHMMGAAAIEDLTIGQIAINALVALGTIFAIRTALSIKSKQHLTCQIVGLWVAFMGFHNLSHWFPHPMSVIYTPEFVDHEQSRAAPNSLLFRGVPIYFGEAPEENAFDGQPDNKPDGPRIIRGGNALSSSR
ncbi:hypothetical protein [Cognatishimia activa]|uniref:hypothetical protein n=1 Tax=Cognatishimia activa TaxID=1715691 RepID=UPI0022300D6A|nr:hypothetical protein [Cognatishimia activa]UZD92137.1 hypothetical protein M0D42_05885 [Cognatishimia activa]